MSTDETYIKDIMSHLIRGDWEKVIYQAQNRPPTLSPAEATLTTSLLYIGKAMSGDWSDFMTKLEVTHLEQLGNLKELEDFLQGLVSATPKRKRKYLYGVLALVYVWAGKPRNGTDYCLKTLRSGPENRVFDEVTGKIGSDIAISRDITDEERERAIRYLMDTIAEDDLRDAYNRMQKEGPEWCVLLHHGFGTDVRNSLRMGGFNWGGPDYNWLVLDEYWHYFVEGAAKMIVGPIKGYKMLEDISDGEKEKAICYLVDTITDEAEIYILRGTYEGWHQPVWFGHSLASYVMKVLKEGGFHWQPTIPDDFWFGLVEEAARRVMESAKGYKEDISDEEWEKAIHYLVGKIPESDLHYVRILIQREETKRSVCHYRGFSASVKSALSVGGFDWHPSVINIFWPDLIEGAAERYQGV